MNMNLAFIVFLLLPEDTKASSGDPDSAVSADPVVK